MTNLDDVADILNRINEALEGTGYLAVGYDNTGLYLKVLIDEYREEKE